jgi:hypothetical protein
MPKIECVDSIDHDVPRAAVRQTQRGFLAVHSDAGSKQAEILNDDIGPIRYIERPKAATGLDSTGLGLRPVGHPQVQELICSVDKPFSWCIQGSKLSEKIEGVS